MYNSKRRISSLLMIILSFSVLTGCFSGNQTSTNNPGGIASPDSPKEAGDTDWKFEKNIKTPLSGKTDSNTDLLLGNLATDKVEITLPKGSTDSPLEIKLNNPDSVPKIVGENFVTLGAPIEIGNGKPMRLNEKVNISFAFDKSKMIPGSNTGTLRVVYFNGDSWSSIRPDNIDLDKGIVTFSAYHFSLFGLNQIDSKKKITEEWIHSKTLDDELKKNLNKMSDHVTNQIIDLTLQKIGLNDKDIKSKVLKDILKDDGYKKIYDSYEKGDVNDLNQKIALLAGKKISQIVPASTLQTKLKGLTGAAGDVKAASEAAGYIAAGRYEDAARIIGGQITDKFIIGKAGKMAVEAIDHQISVWKSAEVEAAYGAFKDGANGKFWGYNVDKGDFDAVWDQMRGIRRQIELEAIKKENANRRDAGMPALTEAQSDMIREGLKESFRSQFTERNKREDIFKKKEEILKKLVDTFESEGFFDSTRRPAGLDKGFDYENELDVLYHFADKMMRDTNRYELSDLNGLIMKDKISTDDIAQGVRLYFSKPDGPKKYAEYLKSRFNITLAIDLANLAGNWPNGTMTIKDVVLKGKALADAEKAKNEPKNGKSDGGCDFSIDLRQMKGKTFPASLTISANGKNSGSFAMNSDKGSGDPVTFTYNDGVIKGSITKDGASGTINLTAGEKDNNYTLAGEINLDMGPEVKIVMGLVSSKAKVAPATKK